LTDSSAIVAFTAHIVLDLGHMRFGRRFLGANDQGGMNFAS
jgi:hypothetical protein